MKLLKRFTVRREVAFLMGQLGTTDCVGVPTPSSGSTDAPVYPHHHASMQLQDKNTSPAPMFHPLASKGAKPTLAR